MMKLQSTRDKYLQHLIDEIRMRRTSSSSKTAKQCKTEGKSSVIETFLSLQDLEPEFLTDTVIKSVIMTKHLLPQVPFLTIKCFRNLSGKFRSFLEKHLRKDVTLLWWWWQLKMQMPAPSSKCHGSH
ncbi:hypothetical protein D5086_004644 [Populus alba]|uniref:Uncharacterized protein n=1 Tax=Populus alba TaxID=43335 RepID=A0ACC4CS77_POPAL